MVLPPTARAAARGAGFEWVERQSLPITPMNDEIVEALRQEAEATGEPFMVMPSGAAHDTMCVADKVPTAMVFVPCVDGLSHTPLEDSDTRDAALAAEIVLGAIIALQG
jgi:acetylornithine deacetylase/succinyl-diaminopimelate desuccinylase-like protein